MVSGRRCSRKDATQAPSLEQHIGAGSLGGSSGKLKCTPEDLYRKPDDGSLDSSDHAPSCLTWRDVPTLKKEPQDDDAESVHLSLDDAIEKIPSQPSEASMSPKPAGLLNFLNRPKRMLGRMRSSPSVCSGASSSAASHDVMFEEAHSNNGEPKATVSTTTTPLTASSLLPKLRRRSHHFTPAVTPASEVASKPSQEAPSPLVLRDLQEKGSNHESVSDRLEKVPGHDSFNSSGNLNSSGHLGTRPKLSVVIRPLSKTASKKRTKTATLKPLSRVPKEIILIANPPPISPLRIPKFVAGHKSGPSNSSSSDSKASSKRSSTRRSESVGSNLGKSSVTPRDDDSDGCDDSFSVASEYSGATSGSTRQRSDPPARIQRTSSKDSTSLLYKHAQSGRSSQRGKVEDSDSEEDDCASLWSDCQSTSNFTSCGIADDDQSTTSDASILLEQALHAHKGTINSNTSAHNLDPGRISPTRRYSVDNGVLADIARQLYSGDERLSNSFLMELDSDDEEDDTAYNTSLSSMQEGRVDLRRKESFTERNSTSDQNLHATFDSSMHLSGIKTDDDDKEDDLHLSSYLPGSNIDVFSTSCPAISAHGVGPGRATTMVGVETKLDAFDRSLPEIQTPDRLLPLPVPEQMDCTSLLKPKRRPKSALSLDKDATKKKRESKRKDRSKSVEVYE